MSFNKKFRLVSLALTFLLLLVVTIPSVFAATVVWSGNGTTNGYCNTLLNDPTVTQGQQVWQFNLTQIDGSNNYTLSATFNTGTYAGVIRGVQGNNVQFNVTTPEGAILSSATATGGTVGGNPQSVLTVSHCSINPPPLQVSKTATTSFTRTYEWDIIKSVDTELLNMFTGDSSTVTYTIQVTQTGYTDSAWAVNGSITIHNPSGFAATVTGVSDDVSGVGAIPVNCGVSFPYALGAGQDLNCTYSTGLPDGSNRLNTATATTSGVVPGGSGTADVIFGAPTTTVNATVDVNDTVDAGDYSGISGSTTYTYDRTFSCDADEGSNVNTATIVQTGDWDDATVTVNCYALTVTKDADPEYTRTYNWDIEKSGDQTALTLQTGETFVVNYAVSVTASYTDSGWMVSGTIHIANPAPMDAPLTVVSDILSDGTVATVDCHGATSVPANGSIDCDYSANLADADDLTNTATATLQNYADGAPNGTTDFTGTANVDFGDPTEKVNECVVVSDTNSAFGGPFNLCFNQLPFSVQYAVTLNYAVCGNYNADNTATVSSNGGVVLDSDTWHIAVTVPCGACTLTQGYWKTHSSYGPAPTDAGWFAIGDADGDGASEGPNETFFSSGRTWYQVFWTPPAGNVYYNLAHQYMAARLNIANGAASTTAVNSAISSATTFFTGRAPTPAVTGSLRNQANGWASTLDQYNNGLIGPGHCSE